jgi:hypothetical protein
MGNKNGKGHIITKAHRETRKKNGWFKDLDATKKRMSIAKISKYTEEKGLDWKGDKAGRSAMHKWVEKWKGRPKYCEDCGLDDPNKIYHWSNVDHRYRRILEDYIRRCPKCHIKYDKSIK